ncbi:MAG TPA: methyl-accepting chemotaxis protein [Lachnospiraceae bacterium]|nr:methyl-accepting chemotaxis protein [Lachnospiraceae bacterium]
MKQTEIEGVKSFAMTQLETYTNGVMYAIIKNDEIVWRIAARSMDNENLQEGKILDYSCIKKALQLKSTQKETVYDDHTDCHYDITATPIMNDDNSECESAFLTMIRKVYPIQEVFSSIAPIITELFPEGAFISLTDLNKITHIQRSEKYDIAVETGFPIKDQEVIKNAIRTGKLVRADDDTLAYGPPVRVVTAPFLDNETGNVAGVINIVRPKQAELSLKNMSVNLERQLSEVGITIQELAAASTLIHTNEQEVNKEIEDITVMANQIYEVSNLIQSIANQTKMLGLNASIEAARSGAVGKGFAVVASEINKLSEQSRNTVPKIKKLTEDIKNKVEETKFKSQASLASSQEQVAATEEITATIEEIQSTSVELANIANTI